MPAVLSRLSIFFINYTSRDLDNTKILLNFKFWKGGNQTRAQGTLFYIFCCL